MKSIEYEWEDEDLAARFIVCVSEGVEPDSLDISQQMEYGPTTSLVEVHLPPALVAKMIDMLLTGRKIHTLKIESWGFNPQGKALGE